MYWPLTNKFIYNTASNNKIKFNSFITDALNELKDLLLNYLFRRAELEIFKAFEYQNNDYFNTILYMLLI